MMKRDLQKLKRNELAELLQKETMRADEAERKLAEMERKLESKSIAMEEAGSIAEAAIGINGVFAAAEAAAAQYLNNIKELDSRQWKVCAEIEEEAREQARQMLEETEKKCRAREEKAEQYLTEVARRLMEMKRQYQKMMLALQSGMDIPMELPPELSDPVSDNEDGLMDEE